MGLRVFRVLLVKKLSLAATVREKCIAKASVRAVASFELMGCLEENAMHQTLAATSAGKMWIRASARLWKIFCSLRYDKTHFKFYVHISLMLSVTLILSESQRVSECVSE